MLRSTWRGLETWHGRDGVTLADERARQQRTQTSTYTGAPDLDPTPARGVRQYIRAEIIREQGGAACAVANMLGRSRLRARTARRGDLAGLEN